MDKYYSEALDLDRNDILAGFSLSFVNDENLIYLDGNSLGKLPQNTIEQTSKLIEEQWGNRLIRSWNESWMNLPHKIAGKIARIVGAREDEIFVGDSTTINLYKLVFASLQSMPDRKKIVSDSLNFPADLYVIQGLIKQKFQNHSLQLAESKDGISIDEGTLEDVLDKQTALITLSYVAYKSSFMYDMQRVNELAHQNGSLLIWDLSHAAGAVPVSLNDTKADMAVGCTYKYLNGGPGAPAFLYVRKDLQEKLINPIWSWFSHENQFGFDLEYNASESVQKFATGTPSIISLAATEPGLDIILEAGIDNLREKSVRQSRFLLKMIEEQLVPLGFDIASPLDEKIRGSHISIQHSEGYKINRAMIEPEYDAVPIIPDFRPPSNIRIGIAPLYNSYMDLFYTVERIKAIVKEKEFERFGNIKLTVT